ncbi:hypothetical protein BDQ12DRAFT_710433 [Crucibulum laeve]|uniref:polynucleotide adenylyltransferase n=1 Tax=Crucibulum laeve TaxID=68775 RepID=A0A5C3M9K8_9AGAR|nr:hypothetical protein BDQ12DRAFT_710433 [Crucibulum laeve]
MKDPPSYPSNRASRLNSSNPAGLPARPSDLSIDLSTRRMNPALSALRPLSSYNSTEFVLNGVKRDRKRKYKPQVVETNKDVTFVLTPWLEWKGLKKECRNAEERLHDEIVAFTEWMQPTSQETEARERVFQFIVTVIKQQLRDAEVNLFGSSATGLGLPDRKYLLCAIFPVLEAGGSDIDITVSTQYARNIKSALFSLSHKLKQSGITDDVQVNHFARVPILTFNVAKDYEGSFNVDVGINNSDGLRSRDLVNSYLASMPALRPLVLVVKQFLRQRELGDAGKSGLGSYAVVLMCVSFLQLNPGNHPPTYLSSPLGSRSLGLLLRDFMQYYGVTFPYIESYISISEGCLMPKERAEWIDNREPGRLVVQCPMYPENDVSKSINGRRLELLKDVFKLAYANILELELTNRNTLGLVVSVNKKLIDHREHIREIVNSGRLNALEQNQGSSSRVNFGFASGSNQQRGQIQNPQRQRLHDPYDPGYSGGHPIGWPARSSRAGPSSSGYQPQQHHNNQQKQPSLAARLSLPAVDSSQGHNLYTHSKLQPRQSLNNLGTRQPTHASRDLMLDDIVTGAQGREEESRRTGRRRRRNGGKYGGNRGEDAT